MSTITHKTSSGSSQFIGRTHHTLPVKQSATHRLLLSIWQSLFGRNTGHVIPKIAGLFLVGVLSFQQTSAQQLLDNFDRANSSTVGASTTPVTFGTNWIEVENTSTYNNITSNTLTMGGSNDDVDYVYQDMTGFYPTTLNTATGILTWQFNMRQNNSNPSGFADGDEGIAYVLGCDNTSFTSGSGYAVAFGSSSNTDVIRLVRFTGGLDDNGTLTTIVTGSTDYSTEYFSIKVTYNPTGNLWTLYVFANSSAFTSPATAVYTQIGSPTANTTYIASNLRYTGCLMNHGSSSDRATFDNVYVPAYTPVITTQPTAALSSCGGTSVTFTAAANFDTQRQWQKLISGVWTNIGGATNDTYTISSPAAIDGGDYRIVFTSGAGTTTSTTSTLTVNPVAVGGTVSSSATVCSGNNSGSLTLAGETGTIAWQSSINAGSTWTATGTTTNSQAYTNVSVSTQYRVVVTNGVCTSTSNVVTLTPSSTTLYSVTGGGTYCANLSGLAVGLSDSETGRTYQLLNGGSPTGSPVSGTGNTISFGLQTAAGTYTVVATVTASGCTFTMTGSATIVVNPAAVGGTVSSSATVCTGSNSGTLTLAGETGTIAWQSSINAGSSWTATGNATNSQTYNNISVSTQYRVVMTNGVCTSTSNVVTITPSAAAAFSVSGGGSYCSNLSGVTVGLGGSESGRTYQLYNNASPVGSPVNGTGSSITFGTQAAAGNYTVIGTVTASGCTKSMTGSVNIAIIPEAIGGAVSSSATVCSGSNSGTLTLAGETGTIAWQSSINGGSTWTATGNNTNSQTYNNISTTTQYRVLMTNGTCTSTSTVAIITTTQPTQYSVTGTGSYCAGGAGLAVGLSNSEAACTYQLMDVSTPVGSPVSGTGSAITFGTQLGTKVYTVIATNTTYGCTRSMTGSATVTENPQPVSGTISGPSFFLVCSGSNSGSLTLSGQVGSTIQWQSTTNGGGTWVNGSTTATQTYNNINLTTQYRVTVSTSGCVASTTSLTTVVAALPIQYTVTGGGTICAGGAGAPIDLDGSDNDVDYQLKNGATNVGSPISGTGSPISFPLQTASGQYTVQATIPTISGGCPRTMISGAVIVSNPVPIATASATTTLICGGSGSTSLSSTGNSNSYSTPVTVSSLTATPSASIPNNSGTGITSTITVSGAPTTMAAVTGFSVRISATHGDDNEFEAYLVRPLGTLSNSAGSGGYFNTITAGQSVCLVADVGTSSSNFTNTVFSDNASQTCKTANSAPFTGTYLPENLFSTLTGNPNGVWTLKMLDDGGNSSSGSFVSWSITINTLDGLTYTWSSTPSGFSSGSQNPGVTSLTATRVYQVTETNTVTGCTSTATATVNVDPILSASCSVTSNATCIGANDGVITVTATGGTAPYTGTGVQTNQATGSHTFTVTDALGCTSTCSSTIIVGDVTNPSISNCPSNITVNNTTGLCGANVSWTAPTASDNCSVSSFTTNHANGSFFPIGTTSVTYTALDPSGNSATCTFSVTVVDAELPVITCPANITVGNTTGQCGASVNFTATATDNCSATLSYSTASGSTFALGTTTVTVTATDPSGNTSQCSFTVTVNDTQFPTFAGCPSTITINTTGSCDQTVSWTAPTASDNCSGVVTTSDHNPGDLFPIGTTLVTYTAVDASGNTTQCTFNVVVEDHENPVVTCPGDITIAANSIGCSAIATFSATVTDNCSATLSYSHASGSSFSGTTLVTVTATDPSGNIATCSFNVIVINDLVASSSAGTILCNGGSTSVAVSATGGTAPYSGDGSFTVSAGTYSYTVTDANGCSSIASGTVTQPTAVVASASSTAILCNGGSSTVTVSATGGTAPYSGTGSFTVTAGAYSYSVSDDNGCTSVASGTVSEPTTLVASASATNILCNGGTTTVIVSATGGTAPYSGVGSFTVSAGAYSYTVTDANGCTSIASGTVTEPATALAASSTAGTILCNGGTTSVIVTATGGTAPYTGEGTFSVGAGAYSYTVTDANGCTSVASGSISEPTAIVASASATAILCNGGSSTVTVSATGGTAPYTGDGSFTVSAGAYSYTVTDANGCTSVASGTVTEPTVLVASALAPNVLCNGGTTTVTVLATGGTAPYSGNGSFTVSAGAYSYTVTDANGCTSIASGTVTEPATALAASSTAGTILCNGGTTSVIVTATGGTAPYSGDGSFSVGAGAYSYTVTDANGCTSLASGSVSEPTALSASSSATAILCNGGSSTVTVSATGGTAPYSGTGTFSVTAGAYSYTVTDANGCTSVASGTVTEPTAVVASALAPNVLCNGGSSTVTVSATGGTAPYSGTGSFSVTAGSYSYTITDANGCTSVASGSVSEPTALSTSSSATTILCNGGSSTVTVSATGGTAPYSGTGSFSVGAGAYSYTVTDANGCTSVASGTITEPATALSASSSATAILCNGGSSTVTVSATGGTAPYTGEGSFTVTAGAYSYTVTDANGCTSVASGNVSEPTALSASSSATAIGCNGGSSTVTVSATGGTAPYSGDGTFTVSAGAYSYTVTDANGCSSVASGNISEPTALSASSSSTAILCNGGSSTVTVSATGGTAPYSGTGSFSVTAGAYSYTVTDANGCTSIASGTITEPATALSASSSATTILCNGGSSTITVSATGGTAPYSGTGSFSVSAGAYSYTVTDANGCTSVASGSVSEPTALSASSSATAILCNGGSSTVTVSATGGTAPYTGEGTFSVTAGAYSYTITDANGCTSVASGSVSEPTALSASSSATTILCNGGSSTVTVSAIGGTAPYSGTGSFSVTAGAYSYTVTDANGCTSIASGTITEPTTALSASSSATAILCNGGSSTVTVSATGGTAPYSGDGTFTVSAGAYSYTVTDANGCTSVASGSVSEPTVLSASSSATAIGCNGGSSTVTVSATGGTTPYSGTGSFSVTAGAYSYTVTDANGCTSVASGSVSEPTALSASSSATAILCNGGSSTVTVSATGGTTPYSGTGSFTVTAGAYSYTVTDANGCTSVASGSVSEPTALSASSSATTILCNGGSSSVTVSATGGTTPYSGTGSFSVTAGAYSYTVTDANGCTSVASGSVSEPTALSASSSATAILCNGGSSTVTVSATGGTTPYSGTGSFTVTAGAYSYTVTDANGCTSVTSGTISEPTALFATASSTDASCLACADGTISITSITGGTTPYSVSPTSPETGLLTGNHCFTITDFNGCSTTACANVGYIACNITASSIQTTPILCNGGTATIVVSSIGGAAPVTGEGSFSVNAGSYTYTVTDANGCTAVTSGTVSEPTALSSSSSATAILCNGGSSTVTVSATGGTAPYSGDGTFSVGAGAYSYTVTDANGCTSVASGSVSEPTALSASSSATVILCNGGSSTVTVSATGGTAPYSGTGSFSVTAGAYSYTVTDANGCSSIASGSVSEPTALSASSSATTILCNGGSSTVTVSATGGTAPYSGTGTFTTGAGAYSYTVTDANGCTSVASGSVSEPTALSASSSATAILCNGGSSTVTVSATGGTTPYSGDGTFSITAGAYSYTVTDANGCTSVASGSVSEPTALSASSSATAILCNGGSSTVTVSATGGTAPYTGEGSFSVTAGAYSYTVTDANGCTSVASGSVSEPTALSASSSATAIGCNGGSSTVTVSATGGTAPYSGDGTFTVSAGAYSYTVTDANGCSSIASGSVSEPTALSASSSATTILCNGGSSSVTVSATGGTAPYSGTGSFTVAAGPYSYTVTDANGCSTIASGSVSEPTALSASSSSTAIGCNGGSSTVTVSATGGTAPYSGTGSFSVSAGAYSSTVTDANGCTSVASGTVTQPTVLSASSSATAILCNGGSSTVTISATGGTAPYSGTGSFSTGAGAYSYTVTDANGCTSIASGSVSQPSALSASSSATAILCNGGSSTVTVSATGGTAPYSGTGSFTTSAGAYSYTVTDANGCTSIAAGSISEPTALVATSSAGSVACNSGTTTVIVSATGGTSPYSGTGSFTAGVGSYSYTVTDANGCTSIASGTVTQLVDNTYPVLSACPANISTCSTTVTWTAPTATDNCSAIVSSNYNPGATFPIGTTTVTYTAVDPAGNSVSCSFTVTVNSPSVAPTSILSSAGNGICSAGTTSLSVVGGSLGIGAQWVWYTGTCGGTQIGTGNSITVSPSTTTTYFVRGEGLCGNTTCTSLTITISTGLPSGNVTTISGATSVCPSVTEVYSVNPVANAGWYVWTAPAGTLINGQVSPVTTSSLSVSITFGALPVGQSGYNICVYAANACGSTLSKCVFIRGSEISTPNFSAAPIIICPGTTVTYSIANLVGAVNFFWTATGGATIVGNGLSVQVTFPLGFSTGSICVSGQTACGVMSPQRCLTISTSAPLPGAITGPITVCPGATEVYSIAAVAGATSYLWTAPTGASISGAANGLSVSVVYTAGFVSGQVQVQSVGPCGGLSAVRGKSISTGKLATPGNIVGDPTNGVCGQLYQYSIPSLANATLGYVWTVPAGVTVVGPTTSNSITLQFPANFVSGTLGVAGNNNCGLGYQRSISVYGNPATPGPITGNASVCAGTQELYTWAPVSGTTYYQIQVPVGSTILSGNITTNTFVLIQWGTTAGTIGVKAINGCGVSGTRTFVASIACRTAAEESMTDKLVVEAYPNPNHGQFSVSIDSKKDAKYNLQIVDQTGRILKTSILNATEGMNIQEFNLEGIAAGMYMIRIVTEDSEVINKSIIIQ